MSGESVSAVFRKIRAQWLDILMEIGILLAAYFVFGFLRTLIDPTASVAVSHAQDIINLEKDIGIYWEQHIQSFFLKTDLRIDFANTLYTICYYPALIIFAIWAYWRHRNKYKYMRTVFIVGSAIAFIIFATFPTSPPRFFDGNNIDIGAPNLGYVDTLYTYWNVGKGGARQYDNAFAAMPSLHESWAIMVTVGIWWMTKSWYARAIAVILPIAMFVGIISTANHFILDAVAGAVLISLTFGITTLIWKYKGVLSFKKNKETTSSTD